MDEPNQSMTAMVEYQIRTDTTDSESWLAEWSVRAQDAYDSEPETTAYAAATNVDDANNLLVFERYRQGARSLQKHIDRPAHQHLITTMGDKNMTKRRVMSARYFDIPDFGWWSRQETPPDLAGAIMVILGFRFEDDAQRAKYVELMGDFVNYCWNHEPDTLIYSGGLAAADADRELDLRTGDVIFVTCCTDGKAIHKHANDPEHLALGPRFVEHGIDLEPKFMRTYRTTGHGYLWRNETMSQ